MTAVVEQPLVGISALLAEATSEVLMMRSSVTRTCPIGTIQQIDHENLRRGVRYRVLVPDAARTAPRLAGQLVSLSLAGAAIRSVPTVPMDALVIDSTVVVLPAGPEGVVPALAPLRLPSVVTTTTELFNRIWTDGVPLAAFDVPKSKTLTDKHLRLLSLLYSGYTDEVAAAQLDLSVRTVRRMMSEMTNLLGARSRFQAGAKAAQRGWIRNEAEW